MPLGSQPQDGRMEITEFADRADAGSHLAARLADLRGQPGLIVLALPRGGVPVAAVVAQALQAPLDVLVVRKLGFPHNEEVALGALASGGVLVRTDVPGAASVDEAYWRAVIEREQAELQRRERSYRGDRPWPALAGRTVLLVDDGLATGATMLAAVRAVQAQAPARLVVAVPVASPEAVQLLAAEANEVRTVLTPAHFRAVGLWYRDFTQTTDEQVLAALGTSGPRP